MFTILVKSEIYDSDIYKTTIENEEIFGIFPSFEEAKEKCYTLSNAFYEEEKKKVLEVLPDDIRQEWIIHPEEGYGCLPEYQRDYAGCFVYFYDEKKSHLIFIKQFSVKEIKSV